MSHFPDRESPRERFQKNECVDCGKKRKIEGRTRIDYWTSYAYEEGHEGEEPYLWMRHEHDWRCFECAKPFYEEMFIEP